MSPTETSNEGRIDGVGRGPQKLALRKGFDPTWVDHTYDVAALVQIKRKRFLKAPVDSRQA
jgi:hypothetical protein